MPNLSNLDVNRAFGIYNQDQFQNEYYGDGIWNTKIYDHLFKQRY